MCSPPGLKYKLGRLHINVFDNFFNLKFCTWLFNLHAKSMMPRGYATQSAQRIIAKKRAAAARKISLILVSVHQNFLGGADTQSAGNPFALEFTAFCRPQAHGKFV